jgi:hypothetical protein
MKTIAQIKKLMNEQGVILPANQMTDMAHKVQDALKAGRYQSIVWIAPEED